jgi:tripartite-type tricarboxylate transporter receptor subunit TctC
VLTRIAVALVCGLALMLQGPQDYPTKPVRMIEPFGAGGGPDIIARAVSPKLSELCRAQFLRENCSRKRSLVWRQDQAAFRDAASRGVLDACA